MNTILRHGLALLFALLLATDALAYDIQLKDGTLTLTPMADNAVRIQYHNAQTHELPEWVYQPSSDKVKCKIKRSSRLVTLSLKRMTLTVSLPDGLIRAEDAAGKEIFSESAYQLSPTTEDSKLGQAATLSFKTPEDEALFGLGQFQDGYLNIRGLSRRLTQVNTQISIPMITSSRGYGLLWNNYGLTEYNPGDHHIALQKTDAEGQTLVVDQTSTHGNQREQRQSNTFEAQLSIAEEGDYAILLDVGQPMARRHQLIIDNDTVLNMMNIWLPPTASIIVHLKPGQHQVVCNAEHSDKPSIYYRKVNDTTTFYSPVAECVDFTLFTGSADEVIASYRNLTGKAPMMPLWALGYIHCRERFHSSDEIIQTARQFRQKKYPIDMIVQDWQYWGPNGWNAMTFDKANYPDPALLVDSLHAMDMRLMLSVWSKIDKNSVVGKEMEQKGYYIPGTDWIDFFNPAARNAYWDNFSRRLLKPFKIDAWWQDATEPENDDLKGRVIGGSKWKGEQFRNMYTLLVSKTVYEGSRKDMPNKRTMILTRCGFPGIQRYGSAVWSGDVGFNYETLRRQITAGLSLSVTGLPWWTYDAGGFFRPGQSQYTNKEYQETMLRWLQTATFLPLTRVHGYMTNTEFWNYRPEVERVAHQSLDLRYRLLPYIYSLTADVSHSGGTILRPLVMDFASDTKALAQKYEYMFGKSLLVCPIVEGNISSTNVYLPARQGGWYRLMNHDRYQGSQTVTVPVTIDAIPVFVAAGTILPLAKSGTLTTQEAINSPLEIQIYPGKDGDFNLYFDDGETYQYEKGEHETIRLHWDDHKGVLSVSRREGAYSSMPTIHKMTFVFMGQSGYTQAIDYQGRTMKIKLR